MRHRSKKREALYRERRPLVERLLREHPECQACVIRAASDDLPTVNQRQTVDVHELVRRSQGGSLLDEKNLITICRPCHTWVTGHPLLAESLGLHLPGWAKDDMWEEAARVRESWLRGEPTLPSWLLDEPYQKQ